MCGQESEVLSKLEERANLSLELASKLAASGECAKKLNITISELREELVERTTQLALLQQQRQSQLPHNNCLVDGSQEIQTSSLPLQGPLSGALVPLAALEACKKQNAKMKSELDQIQKQQIDNQKISKATVAAFVLSKFQGQLQFADTLLKARILAQWREHAIYEQNVKDGQKKLELSAALQKSHKEVQVLNDRLQSCKSSIDRYVTRSNKVWMQTSSQALQHIILLNWRKQGAEQEMLRSRFCDLVLQLMANTCKVEEQGRRKKSWALKNLQRKPYLANQSFAAFLVDFNITHVVFNAWKNIVKTDTLQESLHQKIQKLDSLTACLPVWIQKIGNRRLLERAWISWRLFNPQKLSNHPTQDTQQQHLSNRQSLEPQHQQIFNNEDQQQQQQLQPGHETFSSEDAMKTQISPNTSDYFHQTQQLLQQQQQFQQRTQKQMQRNESGNSFVGEVGEGVQLANQVQVKPHEKQQQQQVRRTQNSLLRDVRLSGSDFVGEGVQLTNQVQVRPQSVGQSFDFSQRDREYFGQDALGNLPRQLQNLNMDSFSVKDLYALQVQLEGQLKQLQSMLKDYEHPIDQTQLKLPENMQHQTQQTDKLKVNKKIQSTSIAKNSKRQLQSRPNTADTSKQDEQQEKMGLRQLMSMVCGTLQGIQERLIRAQDQPLQQSIQSHQFTSPHVDNKQQYDEQMKKLQKHGDSEGSTIQQSPVQENSQVSMQEEIRVKRFDARMGLVDLADIPRGFQSGEDNTPKKIIVPKVSSLQQ